MGIDILSLAEQALATAYDDLGKTDLGDCVRGGRKYLQLIDVSGQGLPYWPSFKGFLRSFDPSADHHAQTKAEWVRQARFKYADDEGLQTLIRRSRGE